MSGEKRTVAPGDYSTAQHQRICDLEAVLGGLLRMLDGEHTKEQLAFMKIRAAGTLEDGALYHADYGTWLTKQGY